MSRTVLALPQFHVGDIHPARGVGRLAAVASLAMLPLLAQLGPTPAPTSDALKFFKNYFVTGDYVVAGVGLRGTGQSGWANGTITVSEDSTKRFVRGDPNVQIVAAYLYWETLENGPAPTGQNGYFRGFAISGTKLGTKTSPCWSSGGATGASNGSPSLGVYRKDVLRYFLPLEAPDPAHPGKQRLVNRQVTADDVIGTHAVTLVDSGNGNQAPVTEGASLVIVYRVVDPGVPLKAVVIYDGAYTMDQSTHGMTQTIKGFYQASTAGPTGRLTHIVGDGQSNFPDEVLYNGSVIALNAFNGALLPEWDNLTFNVNVPAGVGQVTTSVDGAGFSNFDCLSWGAVVFSTPVQDSDGDGLLDTWETNGLKEDVANGFFGGCAADFPAPCVDLPAMGADPSAKDLFVEIDYMVGANGHSHVPKLAALDMLAKAYQNAPVDQVAPGVFQGIKVHFDVGNNYQQSPPLPYIVPAGLAQGGEAIPEQCTLPPPQACAFPDFPGTVGWKAGFGSYKEHHFQHNRKDIFHYALFAHTIGLPPGATIPTSATGVADQWGGDVMVTLGRWPSDNPAESSVGSSLVQAGTLMHELGHNLGLKHGGDSQLPNCKPNYESVMNYLFQVRGFTSAGVLDYSRQDLPPLNESSLNEPAGLGSMMYPTRWYAPFDSSNSVDKFLNNLGSRLATRHCDGTPKTAAESAIRVDGTNVSGAIDWNNDGTISAVPLAPQDLNFNGTTAVPAIDGTFVGFNDWAVVDLRQIGARRNAAGFSGDLSLGDLSLGDLSLGDLSLGDLSLGDLSLGDLSLGDLSLGISEVDFETATSVVVSPTGLTAKQTGKQTVTLNWNHPGLVQVRKYGIYRAIGVISATNLPVLIKTLSGTPPPTSWDDTTVKNNVIYTYFVTASNADGNQSAPSNTSDAVTVTSKF